MEEIMSLISNVGFPIAITTYCIVKFEKTISEMTKAITELTIKITK